MPFGPPMFPGFDPTGFKREYKCKSIMYHSQDPNAGKTNYGGKIYLPPQALQHLMSMPNIEYPMMFKLGNKSKSMVTHAGVLEFTAPPDTVLLPFWMMRLLLLKDEEVISVEYTALPKASFAKFQAQSVDFVEDISDHRAVLERHLRDFACLSQGDVINVHYLGKDYEILVMETKPAKAVSIIDTDMNVDFETPVGYQEPTSSIPIPKNTPLKSKQLLNAATAGSPLGTPEIRGKIEEHLISQAKEQGFVEFTGGANRLDGKKKGTKAKTNQVQADFSKYKRGIPNYDFQVGTVTFIRANEHSTSGQDDSKPFEAFGGSASTLKKSKSKK